MRTKITIILIGLSILLSSCAKYHIKQGDKEQARLNHQKAISHYSKVLKNEFNEEITLKLAQSYKAINNYDKSFELYQSSVSYIENYECANMFNYAQMLMAKREYELATKWFTKYIAQHPEDVVAQMLLASCKSVKDFYRDTTLYKLEKVDIEKMDSWFGSANLGEGIVFTGEEELGTFDKQNSWTGNAYLNLYYTEKDVTGRWISPELLKGSLNGNYHEGPAVFTKDGKKAYFTRSNYYKYKLQKSSKDENNLKIFTAEFIDGKWKNLKEFPFNSDEYSNGHPALSADEKTLYFISDKQGGIGGTDIYYSTLEGEVWSKPINLGKEVNTPGNEMFPYSYEDGTFYFSSTAHNNLGGLDVFMTSNVDGRWLTPENLNYPLNSSKDDFSYMLNKDNKTGYVSSNRNEGDKIYEFEKNPPKLNLIVNVVHRKDKTPFKDANVVLELLGSDLKYFDKTSSSGVCNFKLTPNQDYSVLAGKAGFFAKSNKISTVGEKYSKTFEVTLELDEMIINKPIVIENIYYDLDKWFIRDDAKPELDKLVQVLKDNPEIVIELSSHTDSRASDQYNMVLSDKRAQAAVEYIIAQGISSERITSKGYGETQLVNHCNNKTKCTEEEHQKNRRTEFKVVRLTGVSKN